MYVKVRITFVMALTYIILPHDILLGWTMGSDEGAQFNGCLIHQLCTSWVPCYLRGSLKARLMLCRLLL